jgi:predicted permease
MNSFLQDLSYAVRQLAKSPAFTIIAILTLALGIGANTALFSVVNGVLLNPLPFSHPEQLVAIHESKPNFDRGSISFPNFRDWRKDNHTFSAMAVSRPYALSLTGMGEAEQVDNEFISSDYFTVLGVRPLLGRLFVNGEDEIGAAPVALVSEGLWKRKLNSSPDAVGASITLDGRNYTIIGIIPASFRLSHDYALYLPLGQWNNPVLNNRSAGLGLHGIGRLQPGVTIQQAQADMDTVTRSLAQAYPDADKEIGSKLVPLKTQIVGSVKPILVVLLVAVGFVLLIACVNVANLLLVRSTGRSREFAIRAALGAGQGRLIQQLLTESVLLAAAGGALGLLLAYLGTRAALTALPTTLPRASEIRLDGRVLGFTVAISFLVGILFGLVPTLRTTRPNLQETLKEGGRGASGARHRAQDVFVVMEMALALVLLIGAGLLIRSLVGLWNVDPGFNPQNVLSFGISFPPSMATAKPEGIRAALRDLDRRVAALPGVQAVSQTWGAVPLDDDDEQVFWPAGQPKPASESEMNWAIDYIIGPDYLRVMQVPLQRGRFLSAQDNEHSTVAVVVDDVFARKFYPGQDAVGQRINLNEWTVPAEIVGVVGHVKQWGLDADDIRPLRAQFYLACLQMPDSMMASGGFSATRVLLRTDGTVPTSQVFDSIRQMSSEMSSEQVIFGTRTMNQVIADSLAQRRFSMTLLAVFAALALLLASVGIYGVISYLVARRTQEIGIRMALGADRMDVARLVLQDGMKRAIAGVAIGIVSALALTRLMTSMLYGVSATDPLTFLAIPVLMLVVAFAACYVPARRATRVDPVIALRYD